MTIHGEKKREDALRIGKEGETKRRAGVGVRVFTLGRREGWRRTGVEKVLTSHSHDLSLDVCVICFDHCKGR